MTGRFHANANVFAFRQPQLHPGIAGGRKATGIDAVAWAEEVARRGAGEILLTSMDRDGTKDGFDLALTRAVARAVPILKKQVSTIPEGEGVTIIQTASAAGRKTSMFPCGTMR